MGIIRKLPDDVAIMIAAGEVVERPSSVIKELVENALDAGATKIEIGIVGGGRTKIEVRDNGKGMDSADAQAAFLRHGTSKIATIDDLNSVATLGFRGEALATIGTTGHVVLETTETNSSIGHKVTMMFGQITPAKPHPPIPGTTITVTRLFESVPARSKFLKSEAIEWKASLEIIIRQMLVHPEVAFIVKHNEKIVYDLSVAQSHIARAAAVWKIDESNLVPVNVSIPHLELIGVVAKPEIAHALPVGGKSRQYLTVNGHPVTDKAINRAVKDAFSSLLPPGMQPSFALHLRAHPGMVDVNVHPRKEEVRFVNGQEVFRFVYKAVSQVLASSKPVFERFEPALSSSPFKGEDRGEGRQKTFNSAPFVSRPMAPARTGFHPVHHPNPVLRHDFISRPVETMSSDPVLCLDNCWLVTTHEGKLLVVDQHAAHERVLYNQLWHNHQNQTGATQSLLIPHPLSLDPVAQAKADEHRLAMRDLGFDFDGDNLYAVPAGVNADQPRKLFLDVLAGLEDERQESELTTATHKRFATLACKAAVKAGDVLSQSEMSQLIEDLLSDTGGFTCPHGRPSHIEVSPNELEKLFKRTGF